MEFNEKVYEMAKECSQFAALTGTKKRLKYLGYRSDTMSQYCAERKFEDSISVNKRKADTTKGTRRRKDSKLGLWYCVKCPIVFEVLYTMGSNHSSKHRKELHYYPILTPLGKEKIDCPKHNGTIKDYRVFY